MSKIKNSALHPGNAFFPYYVQEKTLELDQRQIAARGQMQLLFVKWSEVFEKL